MPRKSNLLNTFFQSAPSIREREIFIEAFCKSQKDFNDLLDIVIREKDPAKWRAAWIMDGCDEKNPTLSEKSLCRIIRELPTLRSEGTLRSFLRLLSRHEIPEADRGLLVDLCFQYMISDIHIVSVKVYAMEIISRLCKSYPDLSCELLTVIEDQLDNNSAGFKARGIKIIRKLQNR
ncbi:MAG: hypothetical protein JXR52_07770 [Bacteroidales bacterium]|nr:hypothetical protein [Bacteroidales bacterium]MBN2698708.1 hypothetical protein [Bacteroidales bacterium]